MHPYWPASFPILAHGRSWVLAHRRCAWALRMGAAHGSCSLEREYVHRAPCCAWALCSWELTHGSINAVHRAVGSLVAICCARSLDTHGSCCLEHTIHVRWAPWAQALRLAFAHTCCARIGAVFHPPAILEAREWGGDKSPGRVLSAGLCFIRRPCFIHVHRANVRLPLNRCCYPPPNHN